MSRALALIGAVCLIAAAVVARAVLTGDDAGDGGDEDGTDLVVACIPELEEACRAIERGVILTVEDPAATIDRLAAGEDVDAWITLDPWPEMATIVERRIQPGDVVPVASSELVLLARTDRLGACDPPTWACLVDAIGDSVAVPAPGTALGTLVLGQAATDFFGGRFAANDLQLPALADRLATLETSSREPLEEIRVGLPEPAATGALSFQLASLGTRLDLFSTGPSAAPATVAVVVTGPGADRLAGDPGFTAALDDLGWDVSASAATTGLPNAGVLIALQGAVG